MSNLEGDAQNAMYTPRKEGSCTNAITSFRFVGAMLIWTIWLSPKPLTAGDKKPAGNCVTDEPTVHVLAEVTDVRVVEENVVSVEFRAHIIFRVVNSSSEPMIVFAKEPVSVVASFAQSKADALSCRYIFDRARWPSVDRSPYWQRMRNQLDRRGPPEPLTRTIAPGALWSFEENVEFAVDRNGKWDKIQRLEVLRRQSPLWLRVTFQMWPNNLELSYPNLKLGRQLRRRWKGNGHLILNDLVSEPVPINLPEK